MPRSKSKSGGPRRSKVAPARHNPLAQQLADRRYARRVVEVKKGAYRRKPKHPVRTNDQ